MKLKNQTHLENCTYEQNVTHLKIKIEPDGLEAPEKSGVNSDKPEKMRH